jgi:hypothetical protein
MKTIKTFLSVIFLTCAILMVFTSLSAVAQYPRFYVCLTNNTSSNVNYKASWCTRAGYDCTSYKNYTIEPGETVRHWGPEGNGKLNVTMHSGGEGGVYKDFNLYGTTGGCRNSSSYRINYNNRGFLRIFE